MCEEVDSRVAIFFSSGKHSAKAFFRNNLAKTFFARYNVYRNSSSNETIHRRNQVVIFYKKENPFRCDVKN